jgi:hypothetical protein
MSDIYEQPVLTGLGKMSMERFQQFNEKGYSREHDQMHGPALLRAAACYVDWAADMEEGTYDPNETGPHPFWPWEDEQWNPGDSEQAMLKGAAMVAAYWDATYAEGTV